MTNPRENAKRVAPFLWTILGLFILRVLGQVIVVVWGPNWLPPMEEWMSGALGYPLLLTSQILIIALLGTVCLQFARGLGWFTQPSRKIGRFLMWFGSIYPGVMIIRYSVRMSLYPAERWTGVSIPILFHCILASFVLIVAVYHLRNSVAARRRMFLRVSGIVLTFLAVVTWIGYLLAPSLLASYLGFERSQFAPKVERGVLVRMTDGVELVADVYRPRRAGQVPTILVRIPLSKNIPQLLASNVVGRMWCERGYNVVFQGVRGRFGSGGEFYPLANERQDGIDTLNWLKKQHWFDGRLGMWGTSYYAYTQLALVDQIDPQKSALVVQLASTSFYDMFYPGGALSLESALYWALMSRATEDIPVTGEELDKGYGGFPLINSDDRAGKNGDFFDDWVQHPLRDKYWQDIDGNERWRDVASPVVFMAGWFDPFLPSQLGDFIQVRSNGHSSAAKSRLIIGPWAHAYTPTLPDGSKPDNFRLSSIGLSIPWFDLHLKGKGQDLPPVRLFVMGDNVWRNENEWPLARTRYVPYYLHEFPYKNLSTFPPTSTSRITYVFDPRKPVPSQGGAMLGPRAGPRKQVLRARDDVIAFETEAIQQPIEITGPIRMVLYVSTDVVNTDFVATLMDVHPNGAASKISDGVIRRGYEPKKRERIEIELWPTSIVLFPGHKLRLHISSSSYPRFDVNPNTGRPIATEESPIVATQSVFIGGATPSHILLPIIPR